MAVIFPFSKYTYNVLYIHCSWFPYLVDVLLMLSGSPQLSRHICLVIPISNCPSATKLPQYFPYLATRFFLRVAKYCFVSFSLLSKYSCCSKLRNFPRYNGSLSSSDPLDVIQKQYFVSLIGSLNGRPILFWT